MALSLQFQLVQRCFLLNDFNDLVINYRLEIRNIEKEGHIIHGKPFQAILVVTLQVSGNLLRKFNLIGIHQGDRPKSSFSAFHLTFFGK